MIRIITDTTCSLSKEIKDKYNIKTATCTFNLDGKEIDDDGSTIETEEFYKRISKTEDIGPLIAPSSNKFADLFIESVKNGDEDIIVITMSSRTEKSYDNAIKARDSFLKSTRIGGIRIAVIDSQNMSSGYGYLAMKVAQLRNQGVSFEDLVDFAEKYKTRVKGYICVSDVLSLVKLGFLKTSKRKMKRVTDDIVMLSTDNRGMGVMVGQAKGMEEVYTTFLEEFKNKVDNELTDFLIIEYSSDITLAERLKEHIRNNINFGGEIYLSQLSPSGGAILGLGSVGLAYVAKASGESFMDLFKRVGAVVKTSSYSI